jgi:CBS domain-containing protein
VKVSEVMTRQVEIASPDDTLRKAAGRMAELDTGVLPVGEGDRLVGMLTDRDIAVRAVAQGKGPDAKVRDAMTPDVKYCFEDEDLDAVVRSMGEQKVRRLPVMGRDKRLVGIVSLGDVAVYADSKQTDAAVSAVSEPGGPHSQTGG